MQYATYALASGVDGRASVRPTDGLLDALFGTFVCTLGVRLARSRYLGPGGVHTACYLIDALSDPLPALSRGASCVTLTDASFARFILAGDAVEIAAAASLARSEEFPVRLRTGVTLVHRGPLPAPRRRHGPRWHSPVLAIVHRQAGEAASHRPTRARRRG